MTSDKLKYAKLFPVMLCFLPWDSLIWWELLQIM